MKNKVAEYWEKTGDSSGSVRCRLCPRSCVIPMGRCGFCGVRRNSDGTLFAETYGKPVAIQVDPIEKKPFACFLPHTKTFSIGTFGCNAGCVFCQNHELSRGGYSAECDSGTHSAEELVRMALAYECESVALTYNEPTVFIEYGKEIAFLARKSGLKTLLVSNGYISREAATDFFPLIDAANFDMKGFSENFYRELCNASLAPVLESIEFFRERGGHLELTNLVIPGRNDSPEMVRAYLDWAARTTGFDTVLHFSAYHPDYLFEESPTPRETILKICGQARAAGFRNVFSGNIR